MICYFYPEPTYFFYSADLPNLLYYSHVPAAAIALIIGFFLVWSDRKFLLNRILLAIAISFFLWTLADLVTWTNIHSDLILFVWSFFGLLSGLLSILSIYFIYVFLEKRDVTARIKIIFLILLAPIIVLAPTSFNLGGFNIAACDAFAFENVAFYSYYSLLGALAMLWILVLLVHKYRCAAANMRNQIVLMGIGIELFLLSFFTIIFLGSYLTKIGIFPDSSLELYGFFGMIIFMVYIGIIIVRFKTFHVNLIASQALIIALLVLIGAQLTFVRSTTNITLTGIALVLTAIMGWILVRSVRREIAQREHIEVLARDLERANKQQVALIHFISHQIKGFISKSRNIFAAISEGDTGPVPEQMKPLIDEGFSSSTKGAQTIQDILNASNIQNGNIAYNMKPFDLQCLIDKIVGLLKPNADAKGVELTLTEPDGPLMFTGDQMQLENAFKNLVDNTIRYTPQGSIKITLEQDDSHIRFTTEDTGVGITPADMEHLFTEGGHGAESQKVNIESTGFGLYIVKNIIEAHKGKVWAESEGAGKGSKFIVELPVS
jgi:signal transduction histidine kinase